MKKYLILFALLFSVIAHAASVPAFYGTIKQAEIKHANIAYYRFGEGKPLILVTGHGDTMTMWHPEFLKKMSKNHEVIIFDYPGIGASTIEGNYPNSMEQFSQIVQGFIATQNVNKPDILGFSMGGSLVLYMLTKAGDQFDHAIVIGAKAGGKKTIAPQSKFFNMLSDPEVTPANAIKTLLFPATAAKQANAYLEVLAQMPQEEMNPAALKAQAQTVTAENNGIGLWNQMPHILNNVLVVNGTDDLLTPVKNAAMIAEAIPGAWMVQIKDAGHGVLFQEPGFMADLAELFLNTTARS